MLELTLFELKKLHKSIFFRIMLLLLILFLLIYYTFVYFNTVRLDELINEEKSSNDMTQKELIEIEEAMNSGEIDSDDRDALARIEYLKEVMTERETKINAYEDRDWSTLLSIEIAIGEEMLPAQIPQGHYTYTWPTLFTTETQYEWNKLMRDKGIEPIFPIHMYSWMTVYDELFQDEIFEKSITNWSKKYSSVGVHYINHVYKFLFTVFGVVFFIFLIGDVIAKEGLKNSGPIHFLHTQPIKRYKILITKFLTISIVSIAILLGIAILSLLLGVVFDRLGDWDYPVLIYGEEYSYSFMNLGTFLLKSTTLFIMILLFSYSILFLFSMLTKRILPAIGLTIATIIIGIRLGEEAVMSNLAPYIPFQYFSVPKVISNELAVTMENFDYSYATGMIVLSITTLIVLTITHIVNGIQTKYGN